MTTATAPVGITRACYKKLGGTTVNPRTKEEKGWGATITYGEFVFPSGNTGKVQRARVTVTNRGFTVEVFVEPADPSVAWAPKGKAAWARLAGGTMQYDAFEEFLIANLGGENVQGFFADLWSGEKLGKGERPW